MIDTNEIRKAIKNREYWKYSSGIAIYELCDEVDRLRRESAAMIFKANAVAQGMDELEKLQQVIFIEADKLRKENDELKEYIDRLQERFNSMRETHNSLVAERDEARRQLVRIEKG